jgi:hypothetical protein
MTNCCFVLTSISVLITAAFVTGTHQDTSSAILAASHKAWFYINHGSDTNNMPSHIYAAVWNIPANY